jgi:mannose-6-phosphate isomerase-like protein (cupin superfamily)
VSNIVGCPGSSTATVVFDDPVLYPASSSFDNHFRDCDEYWIICEGDGVAGSEGRCFEVQMGDYVVKGRGSLSRIVSETAKARASKGQGR